MTRRAFKSNIRGAVVSVLYTETTVLFEEGHTVRRWFEGVGREFERNAKTLAPVNKYPKAPGRRPPGHLRDSIEVSTVRVGPEQLTNTLTIRAGHAKYVIRGTTQVAPITATGRRRRRREGGGAPGDGSDMLAIWAPQLPGAKATKRGYVVRASVNGQRRNAFLDRAARMTAANHSSIRGLMKTRGIGTV